MRFLSLTGRLLAASLALGSINAQAPNANGFRELLEKFETDARNQAKADTSNNGADAAILQAGGRPLIAGAPGGPTSVALTISTDNGGDKTPPPTPTLAPPELVATVHGDWPPTGFCDLQLAPRAGSQGLPNPACNDKASGVTVPFGLQVRMCEHDGGGGNWGACKEFPPGSHGVGADFNDKATSFWVTDGAMSVYFTSASDEVPPGLQGEVSYSGDTDGNGKLRIKIGIDQNWYTKTYEFTLPDWCPKVQVWESTRNDDATWNHTVNGRLLTIVLRVKPRPTPLAANNWVGVGMRCTN